MGFFQQTKYLIRKNYQHKRRNKRETFQEILIPLWWLLILLAVRLGVRRTEEPAITDSEIPTVAISTPGPTHVKPQNGSIKPTVGYVTNNISSARAVMELVKNHSGKAVNYLEFNSTDSLVQFYKEYSESKKIGVGLEFGKGKHEGLAYTIRIAKKSMPSPETKVTGQGKCHDMTKALSDPYNCPANSYFILGTATLQASVDAAITKVVANLPYYTVPNITAKMMPKTSFTPSVEGFSNIVSIYLVIAFTPYVTVLLVNLVQEKEKKLKELMRIMGMWDSAYWFSWVITYAVVMLVAVLILNAIAVPAGIFGKSNFGVMVILFYLYGLTVIMFALMWTPFFKNAKTAGFAASVTTILFSVIPLAAKNVSSSAMWALSLLSPTAFAFSLGQAVNIPAGLQFSNLSTEGSFPVINVIIMLIVDIILYFLLALYFDSVIPAEYGQRKPPYFIFMPSFWKNLIGRDTKNKSPERQLSDLQQEHSEDIEEMPAEMRGNGAVRIHKLRKVFHGKEDVVAVDGVSMEIYEGHVTALLGHNGAGKTTLIAMVTGMVPPSGGSALVYGMDITDPNQMQNIRKIIGVCHQQNVLFDFLNVREHLELYCGLKQITGEAMDNTVSSLMKEIDLKDQEETLSKDLSGGQKRKLCVGIALIGDPKVLILDEPTSGMDPYSRRLMWSLLQEKCKDKVVLLTTHFMDEADILAEYKAVLSKGKVRCAGSSLFLKNRFGIGYHLNMALTDDCDTERLTNLVQRKVQGAQVIRRHGREMALALPMEQVSHFSELFQALEEHNDTTEGCTAPLLGVTSYGVSMTSLEEVYLQLEDTNEEETESEAKDETQEPNNYGTMENTQNLLHVEPVDGVTVQDGAVKVSGSASALHTTGVELNTRDSSAKPVWKAKQQLLGLLKTRFLLTIRSPLKLFFMVIVPPILLVIGLVISRTGTKSGAASGPQPLLVSPELYIKPASSESYASKALLQNSTTSAIENVMEYFTNYKVGTELVSSISGLLNSSSHALWNLGFVIQQFPVLFNASQSTPNLASSFEMRYNDTTVHSVPLGVYMISSVVHMNALKSQGKMPYPLETTILPFPGLKPEFTYDNTAFISVLLIGMALAIIPGGFAIEVVAFRQEKIRHILRVSGVPSVVYWLQFFLADATIFLIPVVLMLILIPAFQLPSLSPAPAVGCIILAVLLFLPAAILFSYAFSFLFSKWDTCQQVMPSVFNMGGFLPFAAVAMVDMIANPDIAIILHYVFVSLLPPYTVFGALYYIDRVYRFAYIQAIFRSNGESVNVEVTASQYFTWTQHNGIPAALIAPVLHTIILGLLVYYLDQRDVGAKTQLSSCVSNSGNAVDRNPSLRRSSSFKPPHHKDEDVKQEKERITSRGEASIEQSSLAVLVKGLWKRFKTSKKPKVVVKDLYFGVEKGEVFGLLGPNGAGKTTTLNMITGDVHPTRGKIFVAGYDVSKDPFDAFQRMGYCPQIDALWETITLEEHLEVYAKIRGVPWDEIKTVVDHYMSALKITEHAKKRAKELSGGTKRKVSFAMAMLGDPELLLLDEPSTGMDPSARRFLWNTISKNVRGTRGAILTTHSMEEADALCSRVGIMVKGQLKCLGSTQHLKSTYGSGYTLEIKLAQSQASETSTGDLTERLHAYVTELLPGATQSEMFGGRVIYKIPREDVAALSTIFDALERGKQVIGIEEYSFSQSTLEQVFLEFAKEQDDDRTGAQDKEPDEQNGEPHEQDNTENNHVMV